MSVRRPPEGPPRGPAQRASPEGGRSSDGTLPQHGGLTEFAICEEEAVLVIFPPGSMALDVTLSFLRVSSSSGGVGRIPTLHDGSLFRGGDASISLAIFPSCTRWVSGSSDNRQTAQAAAAFRRATPVCALDVSSSSLTCHNLVLCL